MAEKLIKSKDRVQKFANVEESRQRLFDMFIKAFPQATVGYLILAELILERNIICGDSLEIMKKKETERRRDHE